MLTTNIVVLKDWKLSTPTQDIHAGDTVTLISEYTKVRNVSGKSVRYIECQNSDRVYVRYPLNEAIANRGSGSGGTGVVVVVPTTIPNLPATCKFTIAIEYDVYPWRKVNVSNSTNEFTLLPPLAQTSQAQASEPASGQSSVSVSLPNNSSSTPTKQFNNSHSDSNPSTADKPLTPTPQPVDNPSTLDKLPVVGGFFQAVGL